MAGQTDAAAVARANQLRDAMKPILEDGEIALVLTKDMNGFFVFPDEMSLRAKGDEASAFDSVGPVILATQFLEMMLSVHTNNLARGDETGSKIIQPFAPKIVKPH